MFEIAWITLRRITERAILIQFGVLTLVLAYVGLGMDQFVIMNDTSAEQTGLGVGSLFLAVFTIFWSTLEIPREIDRKEVHVYLSKPITRFKYLLGKYIGMTGMVISAGAIMMLIFNGCLLIKGVHPTSGLYFGVAKMALFLMLLNAVCLTSSMMLNEIRAMVLVLIVMAAAGLSMVLAVLAWSSYDKLPAAIYGTVYHLLPDLTHYRWEAGSGLVSYLGWLALYTFGWSTLCLLIARVRFERLDLP